MAELGRHQMANADLALHPRGQMVMKGTPHSGKVYGYLNIFHAFILLSVIRWRR